jgi:hypothetical protein
MNAPDWFGVVVRALGAYYVVQGFHNAGWALRPGEIDAKAYQVAAGLDLLSGLAMLLGASLIVRLAYWNWMPDDEDSAPAPE